MEQIEKTNTCLDKAFAPKVYELLKNYRSKQSILDCAHQIIIPNYENSDIEMNAKMPDVLEGIQEDSEMFADDNDNPGGHKSGSGGICPYTLLSYLIRMRKPSLL